MEGLLPGFMGNVRVASIGIISVEVLPFPPCELTIECIPKFPFPGEINTIYRCTATVSPEDTLLPITITWANYDPVNGENRIQFGEKVELSWNVGGYYQMFVSAENPIGRIRTVVLVYINGLFEVYLPLTGR